MHERQVTKKRNGGAILGGARAPQRCLDPQRTPVRWRCRLPQSHARSAAGFAPPPGPKAGYVGVQGVLVLPAAAQCFLHSPVDPSQAKAGS